MDKATAIRLLGGTSARAARELGISASAVAQWPEEGPLPDSAENRVLAWLARKHLPLQSLLTAEPVAREAGGL